MTTTDARAIDLEDLEAARDELTDVVMTVLDVALLNVYAREALTAVLFKVGSAVSTISRAIEVCGVPAGEGHSD